MTDDGSIFRPEALQHRERQRGPGDVLRAAPRWTTWFFYVLLGLVGAAILLASLINIERYARGSTAIDDRGRVVVLLPAALAPKVAPGSRVELGTQSAEVISSSDVVLYPSDVRRRYGIDVTTPSVAVVTTATGNVSGRIARVLVASDPVIVQFVPGLDRLLGGSRG